MRSSRAALVGRIDLETRADPMHTERLAEAAARRAGKLEHASKEHWATVAKTVAAVRGWFVTAQIAQPEPEKRPSFEAVKQEPGLARRVWIAEANRRLDLAAPGAEPYAYSIPGEAPAGIEPFLAPELVPTLKRIVTESDSAVDFHGKHSIVRHYDIRSRAARTLAEKTGQPYTFVDADGRAHPGGWDLSQDDSQFHAVFSPTHQ
jgi:hypothetical protein